MKDVDQRQTTMAGTLIKSAISMQCISLMPEEHDGHSVRLGMSSLVGRVMWSLITAWYRDGRQTWIRANQSSFRNVLYHNQCWTHNLCGLPLMEAHVFFCWDYIIATLDTALHCGTAWILFVYCWMCLPRHLLKWPKACNLWLLRSK